MTVLWLQSISALLFLFLSAALSLAETSFMSLSKVQLARLEKVHPGHLLFWQENPDRALAALLFLNNFANSALGVLAVSMALGAVDLVDLPFRVGRVVFPFLAAVGVIVFAEILPKVMARMDPERWAVRLARPLRWATEGVGPFLEHLLSAVGNLLSWLSRTVRTERAQWSASVIRALLDSAPAAQPVRHLLNNVMTFGNTPVSAVMVPRAEMVTVDVTLAPPQLAARVLASGYSRVPVTRGSIDRIEGMVYAKDLLAQARSGTLIALDDLVRPLLRVSVDTPLAQVLRVFRQGRHHIALGTDRGGRVVGLVTLQDVLEAIVGDIAHERRP